MRGYLFISNGAKPGMTIEKETYVDVSSFSRTAIEAACELGFRIYQGANVNEPKLLKCRQFDITYYNQNIFRSILGLRDIYIAYRNLKSFLKEHSDIEIIHCNTPIGGLIGRLVGHRLKKKVIYTAHGFHFYKGAPLKNWLLFYPVEKFLAKWTDILITINQEDYKVSRNLNKKNMRTYLVPGVGVDIHRFQNIRTGNRDIREQLGLSNSDILLVAVGRLDKNKNISNCIKALSITDNNIYLLLCGEGEEYIQLQQLASDLNISQKIFFLGNRSDIPDILSACDIFVLMSYREGLSRSIMEAMSVGLPCIVSDIRGNQDLIDINGGIRVNPHDYLELKDAFETLSSNRELRLNMGNYNKEKVRKYSIEASRQSFLEIFKKEL